jgi:hypothetical protein
VLSVTPVIFCANSSGVIASPIVGKIKFARFCGLFAVVVLTVLTAASTLRSSITTGSVVACTAGSASP